MIDSNGMKRMVWSKISEQHQQAMPELALDETDLSPRELAVKYTDTMSYYVSESSMYRRLKSQDLITSPAYILMQAADKFDQPITRCNVLWQTDFTHFKIIDQGCYYLSTTDIMLQMVASGRGVAALPRWLAEEYCATMPLAAVFLGPEGIDKQIYLEKRKSDQDMDYLTAFIASAQNQGNHF